MISLSLLNKDWTGCDPPPKPQITKVDRRRKRHGIKTQRPRQKVGSVKPRLQAFEFDNFVSKLPVQAGRVIGVGGIVAAVRVDHRPTTIAKADQGGEKVSGAGIPDFTGTIVAAGEDGPAVRGKGYGSNSSGVALEASDL